MFLRWLLAAVHLLALGIGMGAIVARAGALRGGADGPDLRRAFTADSLWGLAALLWISTGLLRAFAGFEKGSAYYLGNTWFWSKMVALALILVLEGRAMMTLISWRQALGRGDVVDTSRARSIAGASMVQAVLIVAMVFAATAMARGYGN